MSPFSDHEMEQLDAAAAAARRVYDEEMRQRVHALRRFESHPGHDAMHRFPPSPAVSTEDR